MTTIAGRIMQRRITPRSSGRAQWFSALIVALNEAERLLSLLETDGGFPNEAVRLRRRIQLVSSELESLDRIARGEERVVSSCWPEPDGARTAET
ncbi:MAG TPA: hypothetical protein VFO69_07995 [Allosphingosinicella sp.]|nr:hypothetical protein [Allosphingosinicella sp.]